LSLRGVSKRQQEKFYRPSWEIDLLCRSDFIRVVKSRRVSLARLEGKEKGILSFSKKP